MDPDLDSILLSLLCSLFTCCSPRLSVSFPGVPVFSAATGTLIFLMAGRNGHQEPQVYVIMEVSPFLPSVPLA